MKTARSVARRRLEWVLLIAPFLALLGCASARLGAATPHWTKVETEHFSLYTDHGAQWAEATAQSFERWLHAYLTSGWDGEYDLPSRMNVVMPSNMADFFEHAGRGVVAGYFVSNVLFEPWIVMPSEHAHRNDAHTLSTLRHELTHMIAFQAIASQPKWYAEGLATYYETADFDEDGRFGLGNLCTDCVDALLFRSDYVKPQYTPIPARDLFAWDEREGHEGRYYAMAWLLTHYLMSERAEAFAAYQKELGRTGDHDAAWLRAFPDLTHEALDAQLERYFRANSFARIRAPVPPLEDLAVRGRSLTRAEELDLKGGLWLTGCPDCRTADERRERASRSFAAALEVDPTSLRASLFLYREDPSSDGRLARARALVEQHPREPLAWIALGLASFGERDAQELASAHGVTPAEALKKLAPRSPYTWMIAANEHVLAGRRAAAVVAISRALRAAPGDTSLLWNAARLLTRAQACEELVKVKAYLLPRVSEETRDDFANLERDVAACTPADKRATR